MNKVVRYCMKCQNRTDVSRRCGKCDSAYYCSKECQKEDWDRHKVYCVAASNAEKEAQKIYNKFQRIPNFTAVLAAVWTFTERKITNKPDSIRLLSLITSVERPDLCFLKVVTLEEEEGGGRIAQGELDDFLSFCLLKNSELLVRRYMPSVGLHINDGPNAEGRGYFLRHQKPLVNMIKGILGIDKMDMSILYDSDISIMFKIADGKFYISCYHSDEESKMSEPLPK